MLCRILNSAHGSQYRFPKSEKKNLWSTFHSSNSNDNENGISLFSNCASLFSLTTWPKWRIRSRIIYLFTVRQKEVTEVSVLFGMIWSLSSLCMLGVKAYQTTSPKQGSCCFLHCWISALKYYLKVYSCQ